MAMVSRASVVGGLALATAVVLGLVAGCTPTEVAPEPTATVSDQPTATPSPTPEPDPEFVEGGTAGQNRAYFEFVLVALLDRIEQPTSQQFFDELVGAGFDPAAIEVTEDRTRVNDPADSVLIAVQIDGQCLLGQSIASGLVTDLADVLGTGRCLVGRSASLD